MSGSFAFVTLLSSDSYLPGALVLAASLKDLHPNPPQPPQVDFKTVCLVTPETVDVKSIKALRKAFDVVIGVELIQAPSSPGLQLLGRPDLSTVLTKLHVFRLTEYSKIIFLDADILPLQPLSHLFLTPHEFSACPDVGWPDIFNSGCMVLEPEEDRFQQLITLMETQGSWDGADQGLLNEWRGDNWHRLSFTYNTTPTAAYTYAPAYKRFGSTIKAIHFIGQNKPWASIPWRGPIEHPSAQAMQSYGYGDLVDRWFAVYDRHYRPPVFGTEEEYRVQHYTPAWETATFEASSQGFGLEDLKRMALHGVSQATVAVSGEGEYKSMPLEGRIDLMRPARPDQSQPPPTNTDAGDQDFQPHYDASSQHRYQGDHGYRPPGREGLPSYLYQDTKPQHQETYAPPPSNYHEQQPEQSHVQDASHQPEHQQEAQTWDHQQGDRGHQEMPAYRSSSPPLLLWNPAVEPPPNIPPPMVAMAFNEQQFTNTWDLPAGRPIHHHHQSSYHDAWTSQSYSHAQPAPSNDHQQTHQHSNQHHEHAQQQHHHHHQQQQYHHHQQPRQGSSSFPAGNYHSPHQSHGHQENTYPGHSHVEQHRYQPYRDAYHGQEPAGQAAPRPYRQPRPEDFFKAPAAGKIPSHLVREGHYAAVTTADPKPDVTKVGAVFPWEQRARPAPKRVFPDWDPKPPGLTSPPRQSIAEIEEALTAAVEGRQVISPPGRRSPSPPPHVKRKFNPPPSPPRRQGGSYVNAWDVDDGIARYASRLQGRSSPFPQAWPTHPGQEAYASNAKASPSATKEEEEEYTNWTEKAEASSRDGDDEDEDDDGGSAILSPRSSAYRRAAKAKGNSYRHQGVQTDAIVTESRGVQVSILTAPPFKRRNEADLASHRNSYAGTGHLKEPEDTYEPQAYGSIRQGKPLLPAFEEELADRHFLPSTALHDAEEKAKAEGEIGSPTMPVLRKRDSSEDSITTAAESSIISSPVKEVEEVGTPRVRIRIPEAAESPSGGISGGRGIVGRRRVGGRVFSPTTGVDIFKRGSEEVLARFLMQDPSGWGGNRDAGQDPPTPSAIH